MHKVEGVRVASKIVAQVFNELYLYIKDNDNISTYDIDEFCRIKIESLGAKSAAYQYPGPVMNFPCYTCISINNEICHGIANKNRILMIGDIVSVDVCVLYNGYHGDSCITFIYRRALNPQDLELVKSSYQVTMASISIIKPGVKIGTISNQSESTAKKLGYNVIYEFAGHYIGEHLHMQPLIPFYGVKNSGPSVKINDTFTVEPMIVKGNNDIDILSDGWTAVSITGEKAAQFEHTIVVTKDGYEILTANKFTDNGYFII